MPSPKLSVSKFEQEFRSELIDGSAIHPAFIGSAIKFASNEAIAKALGWKGFGKNQELHAALFVNEDGSIWHAKLSKPMIGGKRYCAPTKNGNRSYFPPISQEIRDQVAARYKVEIPSDISFWQWVIEHPEIPIVIPEGGKKALCLLSLGYVAISVYGCKCGNSPDLEPYLKGNREVTIEFDCDTKQKAIEDVRDGTLMLGSRITQAGAIARVTTRKPSDGKGVDDFIVKCGREAWDQVYSNATSFEDWKRINAPKQIAWNCLASNNYQIGSWTKKELSLNDEADQIQALQVRYGNDPNVEFIGTTLKKDTEVAIFKVFVPKCDFDFSCEKILSDAEGGGLILRIRHVEGRRLVKKDVYIKSAETSTVKDFVNALKREYRQNLTCTLKLDELAALLQNRAAYYRSNGGKTYKLADRVGQQDDGTWVFENCQFTADGSPTTEKESLWVFNHQLGETEKIPSPRIAPQDPGALKRLVDASKGFFHPEIFPKVLFIYGYTTATLQRDIIMKQEKCFPQLNLYGDPGGAKTTCAKAAVSLGGMHLDRSVISRYSESLIYELVKSLGGLALLIDDPIKKGMKSESRGAVDNFLWAQYNGTTRKVRGNEQTPHTCVITTSNVALGEGNQATESRLIKLHFPVLPPNELGFPALEEAMNQASGGLSQLIALGYDRNAVRNIRSRLLEFLPRAHARISSSLAMLTWFTQQFCNVAGVEFDAFEYCKNYLCPQANELESDKDSLTDFLEKLAQMRSEGLVGEWNVTNVRSGHKPYLAVDLASVWAEFERRFNPNYSRQSLTGLIQNKGGKTNQAQKFVATKLEWNEYLKAKAAYDRLSPHEQNATSEPIRPRKSALRKCLLIPESLLSVDSDASEVLNNNYSDYATEIELSEPPESPATERDDQPKSTPAQPTEPPKVANDDDNWTDGSKPIKRPPDLPAWLVKGANAVHTPTERIFRVVKLTRKSHNYYLSDCHGEQYPLSECKPFEIPKTAAP